MKFRIAGLPVDVISTEETIERVLEACGQERERPLTVFSCNVDMVIKAHRDEAFRQTLASADILNADGMPIVWLGRRLGAPFPERVAGSELVPRLGPACARAGRSVFLFGAAPGVADAAAERLLRASPTLRVAGTYAPPMGFEGDPALLAEAIDAVRAAKPDVLFVAMGAPRQERFVLEHGAELGAKAILAIGGSLDMLAGRVRRAPPWVQRSGLEWLWRLAQEPVRLAPRYLVDGPAFLPIAWRELWRGEGEG